MSQQLLRTEVEFRLPFGIVDEFGTLHRDGLMRLATAADEILPLRDPRVKNNPAYLVIVLLARVITKIGELADITAQTIEQLYAVDLEYLQDLYNRHNRLDENMEEVVCPHCTQSFRPETSGLGES